jgi:flagellum-specific peptidoglycan hydrolase FlgJ
MNPDDFVSWLAPAAKAQCQCYGLPASVLIAQGALESGWGESVIGQFNLFGRKAVDGDKSLTVWTREYGDENSYSADDEHVYLGDGWWNIVAEFKDYDSLLQACDDWCILITQEPAYASAWGVWCTTSDIEQFVKAIAPVYATDPEYADNIIATIKANDLERFDSEVA